MASVKERLLKMAGICLILSAALAEPLAAQERGSSESVAADTGNPLEEIVERINEQISSLKSYVEQTLQAQIEGLSTALNADLQAVVNKTFGELGLPDPQQSRDSIQESLAGDNKALYSAERATNEVDRQATRASVAQTLSKEGQEQQVQQGIATQQSVDQVGVLSEVAQEDVVTQDVMKRMAAQNAEVAAQLGALRSDALKQQQSQDLSNVNLTNISRAVDGQTQAKQNELVGQGMENLKSGSRARLF